MKKMIGCCGLDCEKCDAYIATINNDDVLRAITAKLWSKLNNVEITPEMINCNGCRNEGVKTYFCSDLCIIRKCVNDKKYSTCAECDRMNRCDIVNQIHQNNKEAKNNLLN